MIAYNYPPHSGIAAQRAGAFTKYLPAVGWRPVVLAGDWSLQNCRAYDLGSLSDTHQTAVIARCPVADESARKLTSFGQLAARIQPLLWGYRNPPRWYSQVIHQGRVAIDRISPTVIWATFPPAGSLHAAALLSRESGIPWVADFRDTWENISHRMYRRYLRAEIELCRSASALITVSPGFASVLRRRHNREVDTITNGFDPEEYQEPYRTDPVGPGRFVFAYTGHVYPRLQDPSPVFRALDTLSSQGAIDLANISLDFWGTSPQTLESVHGYMSSVCLNVHGWVSRATSIAAQRNATIILHLSTPASPGCIPGKTFEYLAAERPVLSVPGDNGDVDALLRETQAGLSLSNPTDIAAQILSWYQEWQSTGTVAWRGNVAEIRKYSRIEHAKSLAAVLERALSSRCIHLGP